MAQYTDFMQTELMKKAIIGGWVLGLGVLAFSVNLTSVGAWTVLVGLGVLPPLIMLEDVESAGTCEEHVRKHPRRHQVSER